MWKRISNLILRNRIIIICILTVITVLMGYNATRVELQYQFNKLLPTNDSTFIAYENFKSHFGHDGMMVVIATDEPDFYTEEKFNAWLAMGDSLKSLTIKVSTSSIDSANKRVVDSIFSEGHLYNIIKDKSLKKLELEQIVKSHPLTKSQVDSVERVIKNLKFYQDIIYKDSSHLHMMMLFLNKDIFNSKDRGNLIGEIEGIAKSYNKHFSHLKFSGLPFIRSLTMNKVKSELRKFILLSIFVTAFLLFLFFRSYKVVFISLSVVIVGVIWSTGLIGLFGYEITALTGLIPPLIIVIGIPNCVYLINKYQQEFKNHGNKIKALDRVIQKVGNATFLTNVTTAIGFGTFIFTHSDIMIEFGKIASISIICIFILSICLVPIIYSFLSPPESKHVKHLDRKWMYKAVDKLVHYSTEKRKQVYLVTAVLIIIGLYGMTKTEPTGNIVADLPQNDPVLEDLKFFQKELKGVMPFEIMLTFKDTVYENFSNISKIQQLQDQLKKEKYLSKSLSIVDAMKFISQAYANGKVSKYDLDFSKSKDQKYFSRVVKSKYFKNTFVNVDKEKSNGFVGSFLDSTHCITRITMQIKDLKTKEMDSLIDRLTFSINDILNPGSSLFVDEVNQDSVYAFFNTNDFINYRVKNLLVEDDVIALNNFPNTMMGIDSAYGIANFNNTVKNAIDLNKVKFDITGTGVLYTKGTTYLVENLFWSLMLAIIFIAILMSFLFRSWKMVLVSLLPNLVPLIFTAALMGYCNIAIKPSTILVFSIALGISIDDTIHFLAKYRLELKSNNIRKSVIISIRETGVSMIYTSIILFFGFLVFIASDFDGTRALGSLVSISLFVAMLTNLVLLPSLLLSLEKSIITKNFKESEDYFQDDQDIDWKKL